MKIPHTIKWNDYEWAEWVDKNLGEKDKDYFMVIEKFEEYSDDRVTLLRSGSNAFWVIPDEKKAMLFLLRFS